MKNKLAIRNRIGLTKRLLERAEAYKKSKAKVEDSNISEELVNAPKEMKKPQEVQSTVLSDEQLYEIPAFDDCDDGMGDYSYYTQDENAGPLISTEAKPTPPEDYKKAKIRTEDSKAERKIVNSEAELEQSIEVQNVSEEMADYAAELEQSIEVQNVGEEMADYAAELEQSIEVQNVSEEMADYAAELEQSIEVQNVSEEMADL